MENSGVADGKGIIAAIKHGLAVLAAAMDKSQSATEDDRELMASVINGFNELVARNQRHGELQDQDESGPMQRRIQELRG